MKRDVTSGTNLPEGWQLLTIRLALRNGRNYEGVKEHWLRWCDSNGDLILTGAEAARQERERAEAEHERAERLAAQLRALGVEPEA